MKLTTLALALLVSLSVFAGNERNNGNSDFDLAFHCFSNHESCQEAMKVIPDLQGDKDYICVESNHIAGSECGKGQYEVIKIN